MTQVPTLEAVDLSAGYDHQSILRGVSLSLMPGRITSIVGGNASGKSTLLRTLARILAPKAGQVLLDGKPIHALRSRDVARTVGLLPQSPIAPEGITVRDLVSRGRHPHQGLFSTWTARDETAVTEALRATGMIELEAREIDTLSGGQRQRAWIAMALAQETGMLLLDEPTTFLDVAHQIDVLDILVDLNRSRGTTIVMVLHDLNLAARYSDRLVAIAAGGIHVDGTPAEVLTETNVRAIFGLENRIITDPVSGAPTMIPIGRHGCARVGSATREYSRYFLSE